MASIDDKQLAVARIYARALLDLAEEAGTVGEVLAELQAVLAQAETDAEFGDFLANPLIEPGLRRQSLEKILRGQISDLTVDALQVINRKGRLALLPAVVEAFRAEHREREGLVEVRVTSAVPLGQALRERLSKAIDRHTGQRGELVESVDPDILGGLVVRVGDEKIDTSVARELDKLSRVLAERASQEILSDKAYTTE